MYLGWISMGISDRGKWGRVGLGMAVMKADQQVPI